MNVLVVFVFARGEGAKGFIEHNPASKGNKDVWACVCIRNPFAYRLTFGYGTKGMKVTGIPLISIYREACSQSFDNRHNIFKLPKALEIEQSALDHPCNQMQKNNSQFQAWNGYKP